MRTEDEKFLKDFEKIAKVMIKADRRIIDRLAEH